LRECEKAITIPPRHGDEPKTFPQIHPQHTIAIGSNAMRMPISLVLWLTVYAHNTINTNQASIGQQHQDRSTHDASLKAVTGNPGLRHGGATSKLDRGVNGGKRLA